MTTRISPTGCASSGTISSTGIVQPIVTVGALPLENVRFVSNGKAIEATLSREPEGGRVVVDYDVTRSETKLTWDTESSDKTAP